MYYESESEATGRELAISDGTIGGAYFFDRIPGPVSGLAREILPIGDRILYYTCDHDEGCGLHIWDNGALTQLPDPTGDPGNFVVLDMVKLGSGVVISARTSAYGDEIWKLDSLFIPTGSPDAQLRNQVSLIQAYPNPTHDRAHIRAMDSRLQMIGYELTDLSGRTVSHSQCRATEDLEVDLSGLPTGWYLATVHFRDGRTANCKLARF